MGGKKAELPAVVASERDPSLPWRRLATNRPRKSRLLACFSDSSSLPWRVESCRTSQQRVASVLLLSSSRTDLACAAFRLLSARLLGAQQSY